MRNRGSVSRSAIVVLCVAALGMLGMDGQDSGPLVTTPGHLKVSPEPSVEPGPVAEGPNGWKCVDGSTCPAGLLKGLDRNYKGCVKKNVPFTDISWCDGECSQCSGSVVAYYRCVEQPMANCVTLGIGPNAEVNCGVTTYFPDCQYHATPPAGEIVTPNGCYCFGNPRPTQDPCMVTQCNGVFGGN